MDSEGQSQQGIKKLPSRFLYEIGEKNYLRIGKISDDLERESWGYIHRLNQQMIEEPELPENTGIKTVEHHIFGKGKVISFDPKRKVYSVQFEGMIQPRSISADYFNQNHDQPLLSHSENPLILSSDIKTVENISDKQDLQSNPAEEDDFKYKTLTHYEDKENIETEEFEIEIPEKELEDSDEEEMDIEISEETEEKNYPADEELPPDLKKISDELREKLENSPNHWNDPNFPKKGWICTGITDLGAPEGVCEMCGYQIIRYVHHMYHQETGRSLDCGCVCAGKLEGDINKARKREDDFKNKTQRKLNFLKKKWKKSSREHEYLKIKNHLIVIFNF